MNALKMLFGVVCTASLTIAQIPSDTVRNMSDMKISKTLTFQHANVEGIIENLTTVIVTGATPDDVIELKLNRSFKQELSSNVDKETVERMF